MVVPVLAAVVGVLVAGVGVVGYPALPGGAGVVVGPVAGAFY